MIWSMGGPGGQSPRVTRIEVPAKQAEPPEGAQARRSPSSMDLALKSTEQALSHLMKVAMEEIRGGADASPHVQAAERDLRNALKQLSLAKRASRADAL